MAKLILSIWQDQKTYLVQVHERYYYKSSYLKLAVWANMILLVIEIAAIIVFIKFRLFMLF